MLNVDLAAKAIENLFLLQTGTYTIGNPEPFVRTYQTVSDSAPFTAFNSLMLSPPGPAIRVNLSTGDIAKAGDSIENQAGATATVKEVIDNLDGTWIIVLKNAVGHWNDVTEGIWRTEDGRGGILTYNAVYQSRFLKNIFYGRVTVSMGTLGSLDDTYRIFVRYSDSIEYIDPITALFVTKTFIDGVADSFNFTSGPLFAQKLVMEGEGFVSFDGYIFSISQS